MKKLAVSILLLCTANSDNLAHYGEPKAGNGLALMITSIIPLIHAAGYAFAALIPASGLSSDQKSSCLTKAACCIAASGASFLSGITLAGDGLATIIEHK